jgi:hypothetical protein
MLNGANLERIIASLEERVLELEQENDVELVALLERQLSPVLKELSKKWSNCGIWCSFHSPNTTMNVCTGRRELGADSKLATCDDLLLFGATTKIYTAAATLQLVEEGKLTLEQLICPRIDPFLVVDKTSLTELFGESIATVTVQHLLTMSSNIPDFDTPEHRAKQQADPAHDITPLECLQFAAQREREPSATTYSSTKYDTMRAITHEDYNLLVH